MTAPLGVGRGGYLKHRQLHKLSIENKKRKKREKENTVNSSVTGIVSVEQNESERVHR